MVPGEFAAHISHPGESFLHRQASWQGQTRVIREPPPVIPPCSRRAAGHITQQLTAPLLLAGLLRDGEADE